MNKAAGLISRPARYSGVRVQELSAHCRHLVEQLPNGASMDVGFAGVVVPFEKEKRKGGEIVVALRFRVSDFGRPVLKKLREEFIDRHYVVRVRRSAEKKLLSQCALIVPVDDMFPLEAIAILRETCGQAGFTWPPVFQVAYAADQYSTALPGDFSLDSMFWKAGKCVGEAVGSAMLGIRNAVNGNAGDQE